MKNIFIMQNEQEAYWIYTLVGTIVGLKVEGDLAEVGVYQGGSARLMCSTKGDRPLHLFDTFNGLPPFGVHDTNIIDPHSYSASEKEVRKALNGYPNVFYHKGRFPDYNGCSVEDTKFCFVHMDVDLYQSTIDCLEFFYPRMAEGGVILMHDYPVTEGVAKAFDEFMSDKVEKISHLSPRQGVVIKQYAT